MKHFNKLLIGLTAIVIMAVFGFSNPNENNTKYEWKQVTTLESVVGAGFGRSSVIETVNGETKLLNDYELNNFFSAAGINMGNVQSNENTIVRIITENESDGWELFSITSTALNTDTKRQGIFITRHLYRRKI